MSTKSASCFAVCLISSFFVFAAKSETLTVTSNADSGDGTLRALVGSAADGDVIAIPEGMTVTLSSVIALPNVSLDFVGLGTGATVSGGGVATLFSYNGSNRKVERRFEFKNLTLSDGLGANSGVLFVERLNFGFDLDVVCNDCKFIGNRSSHKNGLGAVFAHGCGAKDTDFSTVPFSLYCTNCTFTSNAGGSAIAGATGNYTVFGREVRFTDCEFTRNALAGMSEEEIAAGEIPTGYGLFNMPAADIVFERCSFSENKSSSPATIFRNDINTNNGMHLRIIDSDFFDNETTGAGGLFNIYVGEAEIKGCAFQRNTSVNNVIGIIGKDNCILKLDILDSFFEDNVATAAEQFDKGGLFFFRQGDGSVTTISRCAFRRNESASSPSVLRVYNGNSKFRFLDSAFEGNLSGHGIVFSFGQSAPASVFSGCSFIGNARREGATSETSTTAFTAGVGSAFSNCTFYGNHFACRGIIDASKQAAIGCTIVSNTVNNSYAAVQNVSATSVIVNSIIVDNSSSDLGLPAKAALDGCRCVAARAGTNTDRNLESLVSDENIVGKGVEELGIVLPPAVNGSKIKLLDGTSPLTIAIAKNSPLRKAGKVFVDYPLPFDGRGINRDTVAPCIGVYEYVAQGLTLVVR